jgi:hypothetical protein
MRQNLFLTYINKQLTIKLYSFDYNKRRDFYDKKSLLTHNCRFQFSIHLISHVFNKEGLQANPFRTRNF